MRSKKKAKVISKKKKKSLHHERAAFSVLQVVNNKIDHSAALDIVSPQKKAEIKLRFELYKMKNAVLLL